MKRFFPVRRTESVDTTAAKTPPKRQSTSVNPKPVANVPVASTITPAGGTTAGGNPNVLQPKFVVPPIPHPCPYSSILIRITPDGLVLTPDLKKAGSDGESELESVRYLKVSWGKEALVEEVEGQLVYHDDVPSLKVHGLVGFLRLFQSSYLLVITNRSEVGNLLNDTQTVYQVKGVSAIPLEESRATAVVKMLNAAKPPTREHPERHSHDGRLESTTDHEEETQGTQVKFLSVRGKDNEYSQLTEEEVTTSDDSDDSDEEPPDSPSPLSKAIAAQLSFWTKLSKQIDDKLSKKPLPSNLSNNKPLLNSPSTDSMEDVAKSAPTPNSTEAKYSELENKIVRETIKMFVRGGMYFSYTFDITTSLQRKYQQVQKLKRQSILLKDLQAYESPQGPQLLDEMEVFAEPNPTLPLWRRVDRRFWWNEMLSKPLIDTGSHSYVLPIMQGYFQQSTFHVPTPANFTAPGDLVSPESDRLETIPVHYSIISRRSRERAGLRYQRRGIDDEANVANFVETETVVSIMRDDRANVFSHIQIRGSIPVYWSQPSYGLKPPPQLSKDRTPEQNLDAMKRHFGRLINMYGPLTIVNLAEQRGKEAPVANAYRDRVSELDWKDVLYKEYDFHAETKGMKYENISKLVSQLQRNFDSQGFFWASGGLVLSEQKSVFRVNCIDTLDRTNVVQSAFARSVLQSQLEAVAIHTNPVIRERSDVEVVFNDVWANNGDAISKEYAGTSALKGDFTRTGKRDISGLLNDGLNSLSRVYTSTFTDWFGQAIIDYILGHRSITVFSEFLSKLASTDPGELLRVSKIRAAAIETCFSRVVSDDERQLGGWTLVSPVQSNVRLSNKFEDKVVLLTEKALYTVSYEYKLDKVQMFTRIPLGDIVNITKGVYIISPLEEASRNPESNYGFTVTYLPNRLVTRVTTYSLRNAIGGGEVATVPASLTRPKLQQLLSGASVSIKNSANKESGGGVLPKLLASVTVAAANQGATDSNEPKEIFTAFKALPVDQGSGSGVDSSETIVDPVLSAPTCRAAVDIMVNMIRSACKDVGNGQDSHFIQERDIVSLSEAQRMTTVYAKLEYGVKRLLWLGS